MKRIWIRAHGLRELGELAYRLGTTVFMPTQTAGINSMVLVEAPDDVAEAFVRDSRFAMLGKALADGDEPPWLWDDPTRGGDDE